MAMMVKKWTGKRAEMGTKLIRYSLIISAVITFTFICGCSVPYHFNAHAAEVNGQIYSNDNQYSIITYWYCADAPTARQILEEYWFLSTSAGHKCVRIGYSDYDDVVVCEVYSLGKDRKEQILALLDNYAAKYLSFNNTYEVCMDAPYQLQLMQRINKILAECTCFSLYSK
jgi:hypothetical protein